MRRRNVVFETGKHFLTGIASLQSLEDGLMSEAIRISDTAYLLGDWVSEQNGTYSPSSGKEGFSAVIHSDTGIIVVENSRWLQWCSEAPLVMADGRFCGNLDNPGQYGMAYSLPPDLYKEAV